MGQFVRVAYNNEGYVTLGYRTANASVGNEWMLLEVGLTVRDGAETEVLKRDAFSLETPDKTTIPLATQQEYRTGELRGMQTLANHSRDTISYFPGVSPGGARSASSRIPTRKTSLSTRSS